MNWDFNYLPWDCGKQDNYITPCKLLLVCIAAKRLFESFHLMRMPFLSILVLCAYPYCGGNWSVALIQLYQSSLSIRLSFRVMSLSAVVGIGDLGEGSIGNLWLIVLTLKPLAELQCFPQTIKIYWARSQVAFLVSSSFFCLLFVEPVKWLKAGLLFDYKWVSACGWSLYWCLF